MDIKQAIQIVDNATAMLQLSRADHVKILEAVNVIKEFAKPHSEASVNSIEVKQLTK